MRKRHRGSLPARRPVRCPRRLVDDRDRQLKYHVWGNRVCITLARSRTRYWQAVRVF
ncbi:MAG: hypothetical protein DRO73_11015 [Candidatus Thorarchaeota archaeon]|nr:MAG: hypothetical protein DRO73_11015 [Candidatus Thorarchaeota archaeon]